MTAYLEVLGHGDSPWCPQLGEEVQAADDQQTSSDGPACMHLAKQSHTALRNSLGKYLRGETARTDQNLKVETAGTKQNLKGETAGTEQNLKGETFGKEGFRVC